MKKIALFSLACTLIFLSCKKEGCTDSQATNYDPDAKDDNGSCVYPEPDPREPYLGNYWVTDTTLLFGSFSSENIYTLQVTTGGTAQDTVYLNNLWNSGGNYFAILSGSNFSIPSQQVSGPYWASGNGNFTNNVITYQTSGDEYINNGTGPKQ